MTVTAKCIQGSLSAGKNYLHTFRHLRHFDTKLLHAYLPRIYHSRHTVYHYNTGLVSIFISGLTLTNGSNICLVFSIVQILGQLKQHGSIWTNQYSENDMHLVKRIRQIRQHDFTQPCPIPIPKELARKKLYHNV